MTPSELDDCVAWLEAKYRRHGEIEDRNCADAIAQLRAELAAKERALQEVIAINHSIATERQTAAEAQLDAALRTLEATGEQIAPIKADAAALRALLRRCRGNLRHHDCAPCRGNCDGCIIEDEIDAIDADTARALEPPA